MASRVRVLRSDDFVGGLNLRADPFQLADNESPDLLNVSIDPRGGFSMRSGTEAVNATAVGALADGAFTPRRLFSWNAETPQLLLSANGKVFYSTGTDFTDTTIAITSDHGASFAAWSGLSQVLYVAGGTAGVKWDGAADTPLTASATGQWQDDLATPTGTHMPIAKHVAAHVDRLWVANTTEDATEHPDRVRFSHPFFPESWREDDFFDVVDGGSGITALVPFGQMLLVFKRNSIHAVHGYDTDTLQVVALTRELGAPCPMAVTSSEQAVFFFSWPQGLFAYDGSKFTDLFTQLRPLVDAGDLNESAVMDQTYLSWVGQRLWLSLCEDVDETPTNTYVLDPSLGARGAWTRYRLADNNAVACGCDFVTSAGDRLPVVAHPVNPYVLQVDIEGTYTDDISGVLTDFESYYATKWQDAGVVSAKKMWRRPDFVVKQPQAITELTVHVSRDWRDTPYHRTFTVTLTPDSGAMLWSSEPATPGWNQALWGAASVGSKFARGSTLGLARSVRLRVSGPGGAPWGVNSISYKYIQRKVR